MKNKYQFHEIVKIVSPKPSKKKINHSEGIIWGMSQNEVTGEGGYAVSVDSDDGLVWDVMEDELQSTGKKANPEEYMSNQSVLVQVDPVTWEGRIIEKE